MSEKLLQPNSPPLSLLSQLKPEEISDDFLRATWAYEDVSNLYHFSRNTLGYNKLTPRPHADLCDFITNTGKYAGRLHNNWKLILLPRGTYKTTVSSQGYPLWRLLRDPNTRILLDSETYAKSVVTLRSIKGSLLTNPRLRAIHGDLTQPLSLEAVEYSRKSKLTWNEDEFVIGSRTNFSLKEPSIAVGGLDIVRVGMHYDVVISDDLHSEKNVTTKEQIDKVIQHIQLMTSILDPGKQFIIIGTRWDDKDAYGWIIDEIESLAIRKPGIYKGKYFDIMVYPWKWMGLEGSETYFAPEILNEETIKPLKALHSPYTFSCQYMNDPIDQETAIFKTEWIEKNIISSSQANRMVSDGMLIFTAIDPAISENKASDYSAIVTVGLCVPVDVETQLFDLRRVILDIHHGRWNPDQLVEEVIDVYRKWRPIRIGFESVAAFDAYQSIFRERTRARGIHLPLEFYKRDTRISKEARIASLSTLFRAGSFLLVRSARGAKEFLDEYRRFPKGKHDDVLDALSDIEKFSYFPTLPGTGGTGGIEYKPLDEITGY